MIIKPSSNCAKYWGIVALSISGPGALKGEPRLDNPGVAEVLINARADPQLKWDGETIMEYARKYDRSSSAWQRVLGV